MICTDSDRNDSQSKTGHVWHSNNLRDISANMFAYGYAGSE